MRKLITLIAVITVFASMASAQIMYPFGGATTVSLSTDGYDTTVIEPFNNLSVYSFNVDTTQAISLQVGNDLRVGAEAIFVVFADTTGGNTGTRTITFLGDVYGAVSDTVQDAKTYIWNLKYDGTKFFKVSGEQVD